MRSLFFFIQTARTTLDEHPLNNTNQVVNTADMVYIGNKLRTAVLYIPLCGAVECLHMYNE